MKSLKEFLAVLAIGTVVLASMADGSIRAGGIGDNVVEFGSGILGVAVEMIQDALTGDE